MKEPADGRERLMKGERPRTPMTVQIAPCGATDCQVEDGCVVATFMHGWRPVTVLQPGR